MKDRTLLLSLCLAGAIHLGLLFCNFPEARQTNVVVPPLVEVSLVAAPQGPSSPAPPAPVAAPKPVPPSPPPVPPAPKKKQQAEPVQPPAPPEPEPEISLKKVEFSPSPEPQPVAHEQEEVVEVPPLEDEKMGESDASTQSPAVQSDALGQESAVPGPVGDIRGNSQTNPETSGSGFSGTAADTMPAYLYNPKPKYPRSARQAGQEGTAVLRVEVLFSGRAGKIIVEKSSGYDQLDREAVEAVKTWKFVPAQKGKRKVTAWVKIPVEFNLRDHP